MVALENIKELSEKRRANFEGSVGQEGKTPQN